jgi:hypothetical protein
MDKKREFKIGFLILSIFTSIALLLYSNSFDPYIAKHIAISNQIIIQGSITTLENYFFDFPLFYIFSSEIIAICGIDPHLLLYLPIQLIPYVLSYVLVFYIITNNYIISSIITSIFLVNGVTGTNKIFLWPHTIGEICFLLIISILLITFNRSNNHNNNEMYIVLLLLSFSSIFFSYNYSWTILILFFVLLLILYFCKNTSIKTIRRLSSTLLILFISNIGLSYFFFKTFFPVINSIPSYELSSLEKFIAYYVQNNGAINNPLLYSFPIIITYINIVKYILIILLLVISTIYILKNKSNINKKNLLIILSVIIAIFIFAIGRTLIGYIAITLLLFPSVLIGSSIIKMPKKRKFLVFIITAILIISVISILINNKNNTSNNDQYVYYSMKEPSYWIVAHNSNLNVYCDEYSKELLLLTISETNSNNYSNIDALLKTYSFDQIQLIINGGGHYSTTLYIINYKMNINYIGQWRECKPWIDYSEQINANYNDSIIYSGNDIIIIYA